LPISLLNIYKMTNIDFNVIPVIDISPLTRTNAGEAERQQVVSQISTACRDVGFFYITGHGVDVNLQAKLVSLSKSFFSLPEEFKREIDMKKGGRAWRGFFACGEELTSGKPDMKEGIYFGSELGPEHPLVKAEIPMHGTNLFPASVPELKETVLEYLSAMERVGHTLISAVCLSLGLEDNFFSSRFMQPEPLSLFRIFNYPKDRLNNSITGKEQWGVGEHTDYGVLTILKVTGPGLEVKNRQNQWVSAPPIDNSFVVNLGDMLEKMTRGLIRSTPHRVKNMNSSDRLSFPFFFDPNFSAVVEPIGIMADTSRSDAVDNSGYVRWDGAQVADFQGTYGEYILRKVVKVFPELGSKENVDETLKALTHKIKEAIKG
jgi:isopenicillin N synthase-like dioxygenase